MAIEDKKPYYCDYDVIERYFKEKWDRHFSFFLDIVWNKN
jgi:hypothetical protein